MGTSTSAEEPPRAATAVRQDGAPGLCALLAGVLRRASPKADSRSVVLAVAPPAGEVAFTVDAHGALLLVIALVHAALEAAPPLSRVEVRSRRVGRIVFVFVQDEGLDGVDGTSAEAAAVADLAVRLGCRLGWLYRQPRGAVFWLALPCDVADPGARAR